MKTLVAGLLLIGLPVTCPASSQTNSFQCPNGIVAVGDTREEVATKCGKPTKRTYTEVSPIAGTDAYRDRKTYTYESHWSYDPGPNGFVYKLEFSGGKVRQILNTEKYGSR
jgi:hypothetical protein